MAFLFPLAYLVAAIMFIQGIRRLSKVRTAKSGNTLSALAMLIAIVVTGVIAAGLLFLAYQRLNLPPEARARKAIEKAGTLDYKVVAEALHAETWKSPLSLGGEVAFAPGGQNIKAKSLITQLQGGSSKRISPTDLADTEVVYPMVSWNAR